MTDVAALRLAGDVDGLCDAVRHGDDTTLAKAAALLGDLGDHRAVEPLLDVVRRYDERCRTEDCDDAQLWPLREAVHALGQLRDSRAVPALCRLLDGGTALTGPPAYSVERTTLRALVDIRAPEAADLLLARLAERPDDHVLGLLGELAEPRTVIPLLALLWRLAPRHGEDAVRALGKIGDQGATSALLYLACGTQSSLELRRAALTALTRLPGAPWDTRREWERVEQSELRDLLRDPDRELANLAAELLTRTGYGRTTLDNAVHNAARRYLTSSETACVAACAAIGRHPDLFADRQLLEPELISLLDASRPRTVRRAAATALGALGGRRAVKALLNVLDDTRVAEVVGSLPDPPTRQLNSLLARGNPAAAEALGIAGHTAAAPRLMAATAQKNPRALRAAAVDALGRLGYRPSAASLSALASDEAEPSGLRARAVRALGLIGDPDTVPVLLRASRSVAESVRLRATEALGSFSGPEVAARLGSLAEEGDAGIAGAAVTSLGRSGAGDTLAALVERAVEWPIAMQRVLVAAIIAAQGPVTAFARLSTNAFPLDVRKAAARSLGDLGAPECVPPLIRFLDDGRIDMYHGVALRGLATIGGAAAVDRVVVYFNERRYFQHFLPRDETLEALAIVAASRRSVE